MKGTGMGLKAVLFIPSTSDSIRYRAFLDSLESKTFLEWWVTRVSSRLSPVPLVVLCQTEKDELAARDVLGTTGAPVMRSQGATEIRAFAEAARLLEEAHIAFLSFGFAFAPADLLSRLYSHHVAHHNTYTPVHGFPLGSCPHIFNSSLLLALSTVKLPGMPTDPKQAVETLSRASEIAGIDSPISIKASPFDAADSYGAQSRDMPEQIAVVTQRDMQIARRVISLSREGDAPLSEFKLWRTAAIGTRLQRQRELAGLATNLKPCNREKKPSRILYVSNASAFAGAQQSLCQLVSGIDQKKYKPFALVGAEGLFTERLREVGATVISPGYGFGANNEDLLYVASVLRAVQPHLIHLNGLSALGLPFVATLMGVPVVTHVHAADWHGFEEQLRVSGAVIAVSQFIKREVLRLEIPEETVEVIYNGVDCRFFRPNVFDRGEVRRRLGLEEDAKVLLMVARFSPNKRHDLVLKAASEARTRTSQFYLILNGEVFGEPEVYDSVQDYIASRDLRGWIRIVPFVEDIRELYTAADLLALCSDREALGQCVVEAMAMELPVIVTDSGGTHEIVRGRETGFVVAAGKVDALAAQIIAALEQPDLCRRMALAARRYVEQQLDAPIVARRVTALYDQLLGERL